MKRAYCMLNKIYTRQEAFVAGLKAHGYTVFPRAPEAKNARPGDVLVIWNRRNAEEVIADQFEAAGGTVLVAENGYLGTPETGRYVALARHGHNGSGQWYSNGPARWERLGVTLQPWRTTGEHVLVCPNRFIAPRWFLMPRDWVEKTVATLKQLTGREIRVRPHPGNWKKNPPKVPLADDLRGAWVVVIWSSSCGVQALVAGIPVIATAPYWIALEAAGRDLRAIEAPPMPDRFPALQRLAWGQWALPEISSGEAFRCLLPK